MRALIADDEPWALVRLARLLESTGKASVIAQARDGGQAAQLIAEHRPDIAFLDIRMPVRSGISLARTLCADAILQTEVVFVTAYDHFAAEAFDLDAVDYLLKPVSPERLSIALTRAQRRRAGEVPAIAAAGPGADAADDAFLSCLWIRRREGTVRVATAAIEWIEAAGDYVLLHTRTSSHMHRITMDRLQKTLDPRMFMRVSRSSIVHRGAISGTRRLARGGLALAVGDGEVAVGQTYRRAVQSALGLRNADLDV